MPIAALRAHPALPAPCRLPDDPAPAHHEARAFCLRTILEVYGTPHRPDWHADLDSLLRPANLYARPHGGAFWTVRDTDAAIVATAGLLHLGTRPAIPALFPGRYPRAATVGFLGRVYVRHDWRGRGLGRTLAALAEAEAAALGRQTLYLHADAGTPATLAFWRAAGFRPFATEAGTTHFDKPVSPPPRPPPRAAPR